MENAVELAYTGLSASTVRRALEPVSEGIYEKDLALSGQSRVIARFRDGVSRETFETYMRGVNWSPGRLLWANWLTL